MNSVTALKTYFSSIYAYRYVHWTQISFVDVAKEFFMYVMSIYSNICDTETHMYI